MKSSPIWALGRVCPKIKSKAPEPKKVLFHSKVKARVLITATCWSFLINFKNYKNSVQSSGYAGQTKPRKMFQPVTKSQKLKSKKTTLKVAEYNFSRPMGCLTGKNTDYLTTSPTCLVPTPTGKFLIAEDSSIATFDGNRLESKISTKKFKNQIETI